MISVFSHVIVVRRSVLTEINVLLIEKGIIIAKSLLLRIRCMEVVFTMTKREIKF